jgi:hypothetical protein
LLGDVGEGRFGESCDFPFIVLRCDDAAMAAADGSRFEPSLYVRLSWIEGGIWVGELFLGVVPPWTLLENVRDMIDPERSRMVIPEGCPLSVCPESEES